jgi:hypothetical protein
MDRSTVTDAAWIVLIASRRQAADSDEAKWLRGNAELVWHHKPVRCEYLDHNIGVVLERRLGNVADSTLVRSIR